MPRMLFSSFVLSQDRSRSQQHPELPCGLSSEYFWALVLIENINPINNKRRPNNNKRKPKGPSFVPGMDNLLKLVDETARVWDEFDFQMNVPSSLRMVISMMQVFPSRTCSLSGPWMRVNFTKNSSSGSHWLSSTMVRPILGRGQSTVMFIRHAVFSSAAC